MITIVHGSDTASSRKFFLDNKNKHKDAILINGQNVTLTDMVQHFEGGGLFTDSKSFFIEQLLGRKKSAEQEAIIQYIKTHEENNNIFIWEDKELTQANINKFKNATVKAFKHPQSLFIFLESIKPGNGKTLVNLFHQTIESTDVEMVFFMIVRQIRMLLAAAQPSKDEIDETKRLAPWQKARIQKQADHFDLDDLKKIYAELFEMERGLKTGTLPMSLVQSIDFLLLNI